MTDQFTWWRRAREAAWWSVYLGVGAAAAWLPVSESFPVGMPRDVIEGIAKLAASISASLLGFLLAAVSILLALSGQMLLRRMKKAGIYKRVMGMFRLAIISQGLLLALSLAEVFTLPYCHQIPEVSHLGMMLCVLWLAAWPLAWSCYYLFIIVAASAESA